MKRWQSYLVVLNEALMLSLALLSGGLVYYEMTRVITPHELIIIDRVDISIALVFLLEFIVTLILSKNRKFFLRKHWWELLAAIPVTTPATQTLRLLRILRVLRIFRIGAHLTIIKQNNQA